MSRRNGLLYIVVIALAGSAGCSGDQGASAAPVERKKPAVARREAVVSEPAGKYQMIDVSGAGSITGTIQVAPGVIAQVQSVPDNLPSGCAAPERVSDISGGALRGAAVWLTDIRAGKGFPTERRFDLVNENCLISPKVQPVFAGATINVGSNDAVLHHNRFINVATGESEAVAPFNDKGEIIPYDRLLTKTAQYEVLCDVHPWTRGWLVVVDHPYYAQSGANGSFTIDGVPPGTYRIRAWHPAYGMADGTVNVAGGAAAAVALIVAPKAASPAAPGSAGS